MRIYLIRHGQSVGNTVDADLPDSPLTAWGEQQAAITAQHLSAMVQGAPELRSGKGRDDEKIDRIIASPLLRCLGTAQHLAKSLQQRIEVWPELVEVRSGTSVTGPARSILANQFPEADLPASISEEGWHYPGDETDVQAVRRAQHVWQKLLNTVDSQATIAIVAHGTFNGFLLRAAMGTPELSYVRFFQSNCCINVIDIHGDKVFIPAINGTWHFQGTADHLPPWLEFPAELAAKWNRG